MRRLGLILCGLLLTACTSGNGLDARPAPAALTGEKVFGDYGTVDYCTLLDPAGGTPVSSFEHCSVDVAGIRHVVGPVQSDNDIGMDPTSTKPYTSYAGHLPRGVGLREPARDL